MALHQLIYVSTAEHLLSDEEIKAILDSSVRHNRENGITGMLLYCQGSFLQILEGEAAAIDEVIGRIQQDRRHNGINILSRGEVAARDFAAWHMAFRGISTDDAARWPGYAPFFQQGFDARALGIRPGMALEILKNFAEFNY